MARTKGSTIFKYNEAQATRVEKLAMIGVNDEHIAPIEGMSEDTLKRLYKKELKDGRAKGIAAVSQTLFQKALKGDNPAWTMFFMKCRGHWREVQRTEISGIDGKPIDLSAVPTAELVEQAKKAIEVIEKKPKGK